MSLAVSSPAVKTALVLRAEKAREMAEIHNAACRYCRQGVVCSTREELDERAARLARRVTGDDEAWGPDSAAQRLERGPA